MQGRTGHTLTYRKTYQEESDMSSLLGTPAVAKMIYIRPDLSLPSGAVCPQMSDLGGRSVRFYPDMWAASGHLKTNFSSRYHPLCPVCTCPYCPVLS